MNNNIIITQWKKQYNLDFVLLNRDWIEQYFSLEESDINLLSDPEGQIILKGGEIFFALDNNKVVGCCALIKHDNDEYELAKMAVTPSAQGKGIGFKLGETLIEFATQQGIKRVFLEANTQLNSSVQLYKKLGFKEIIKDNSAYHRCNLYMEWSE